MSTVLYERPARLPLRQACAALGLNRSTVYARRRRAGCEPDTGSRSRKDSPQPRALGPEERSQVLETLHSEPYCDQPPAAVYQRLLQQGRYLCSVSTMHRILRASQESGERRAQRPAQHHAVPRLRARAPNEVWTWDITKLPTVQRTLYLSLYVVMDLFSRFVVAWMVSRKENSALAQQLMRQAMSRYAIAPGQLTVHQDRGAPMTAHAYLDLMAELGVTCSHSRPRVSNDNPFSESQFKTLKQQPDYPGRFEGPGHARAWCTEYFLWRNLEHHHHGLAGFTPEQVFTGRYRAVAAAKQAALDAHYARHPERFVSAPPVLRLPPAEVIINPYTDEEHQAGLGGEVNFPTLPIVAEKLSILTFK
jgi:putative transposase